MVMPDRFANGPNGAGIVTPSELKEFLLKPSIWSQKALGQSPPLVLMTSCTSSLPKESLLVRNET